MSNTVVEQRTLALNIHEVKLLAEALEDMVENLAENDENALAQQYRRLSEKTGKTATEIPMRPYDVGLAMAALELLGTRYAANDKDTFWRACKQLFAKVDALRPPVGNRHWKPTGTER